MYYLHQGKLFEGPELDVENVVMQVAGATIGGPTPPLCPWPLMSDAAAEWARTTFATWMRDVYAPWLETRPKLEDALVAAGCREVAVRVL